MHYVEAKNTYGFTLIELLVVIAIIAVLAAVLFPALTTAQARGQEASCCSNLRQIGNAMTMYLQDTSGVFPNPTPYGLSIFCLDYRGIPAILSKYLGASKRRASRTFLCPADPYAKQVFNCFTNAKGNVGGEGNLLMVSYSYRCAFANAAGGDPKQRLRDSDCRYPTKQILFFEIYGWHRGRHCAWQLQPGTGQPLLNAACVDGHVKLWKGRRITTGSWAYDANWFSMGPEGEVFGKGDPRMYWDM